MVQEPINAKGPEQANPQREQIDRSGMSVVGCAPEQSLLSRVHLCFWEVGEGKVNISFCSYTYIDIKELAVFKAWLVVIYDLKPWGMAGNEDWG